MSERKEYNGLTELELGLLIVGVALALFILLVLINVCVYRLRRKKKSETRKGDQERMVNMQTERTVNGQNMKQVIVKSQPNGNMDKYNQNNMPYKTMDIETNTVRYETANQSTQQESQPTTTGLHISTNIPEKVETSEPDVDSGTGESPTRIAAVVVHDDVNEEERGQTNPAFEDETEEIPYEYSMPPPPAPSSLPPPLTPGIPVTDLDADSDSDMVPTPPPPPVKIDPIYAEVNKDRRAAEQGVNEPQSTAGTSNASLHRSIYRPESEIKIIEKAKF